MADIPSTTRLWSDIVEEIDPSVNDDKERPVYEFSNGAKFIQPNGSYQD